MDWNYFQTRLHLLICCVILQATCVQLQVFSFGSSSYEVSESAGTVDLVVQRTGLGDAATVGISTDALLSLSTNSLFFGDNVNSYILRIVFPDDNFKLPDIVSTVTLTTTTLGEIGQPSSTTVRIIDDEVTEWNAWGTSSSCSVTCGSGTQTRTRTCNDFVNLCTPGSSQEVVACNTQIPCPATATEWNSWGTFSSCSVTCGSGTQTRIRTCSDPVTMCTPGSSQEVVACNTQIPCPTAEWGNWGLFGRCSQTCGRGYQTRTRTCNDPSHDCPGSGSETRECLPLPPSCAEWNTWGSPIGECSQTCGGGVQYRTRACNNPGLDSGATCAGPSTDLVDCNTVSCPTHCNRDIERTIYGSISTPDHQQVGVIYESDIVCPWYTRKENIPVARAKCVSLNGKTYWIWDVDNCGGNKTMTEILTILSTQPVTEESASSVLQTTERLTEDQSNVGVTDVVLVTNILEDVVALKIPERPITDMVVDIINNLWNIDVDVLMVSQRMDSSPSAAVKALEDQLQVVQVNRADIGSWPYRRITINVAVEVFEASEEDLSKGIYAASDSRSTNTLLSLIRSNSRSIDVEIEISPEVTEQFSPGTRVALVVFADNKLLTSSRLQVQNEYQTDFATQTNSRVISATIGDREVSDLKPPVKMTYRPLKHGGNNTKCVFWDFSRKDWVTDGCQFLGETPDWMIICECDHLTNFAILMDIYGGSKLTKTQDYILEILSYVGSCLSIIGLIATLLTYSCNRKLKSKLPNQILMSLTSALLGLYIVFVVLLSVDTGRDQTELEDIACSVLAGVLHYFTLASLFWMAVEGYNMYLLFIKVLNSYIPNLLLKASVFAWGGPLAIVAVTAGLARDGYARSDFCFLDKWPLVGGVLVPIGIILIFNITVFIFVMLRLSKESPATKLQKKRKGMKVKRLRNAATIMTLMGLTWGIGYITIIGASTFFSQLIFCLLNAMQGYAIFMMYCVQQSEVRNYWRGLCWKTHTLTGPSLSSSLT